jgi:hypothetical protein
MILREELEQREFEQLADRATKSAESKGRMQDEEKCAFRTEFQRDRDRIIHSKAFRRLMHKTQVFLAPEGDHFRTRLTHTLEVAQIARTIARSLRLNEDLTEAIAMGHDLGHTPFGHNGEDYLNERHARGFKHNIQGLHIGRSPVCPLRKTSVEICRRLPVDLVELRFLAFTRKDVASQVDTVFAGKLLNGSTKIQVVVTLGELYYITRNAATEACENLFVLGNNKRRCLFIVKRTKAFVIAAGFF